MLKRASIRRIAVASAALLILGVLYFFPTPKNDSSDDFIQELVYTNEIEKSSIYLIDNNDYVARASIVINSRETNEMINQIIETLTINGKRTDYIPNGFKPIIPENTKVLEKKLDQNGLLKINFSKEFLEVSKENEEKMIESLIYSLTTLKDVKKIMIFVESEQLLELPKSKKNLPITLDRSYGINKVYDLDNLKNSTKTTIYYISKFNSNSYYVPVTLVNNDTGVSKVEVIINELKSSPIYQTNLMSYLATNAELKEYDIKENQVNLSFNKYLLDNLNELKISEEVKYSIALSIKDTLNAEEVIFNIDDKIIETVSLNSLE